MIQVDEEKNEIGVIVDIDSASGIHVFTCIDIVYTPVDRTSMVKLYLCLIKHVFLFIKDLNSIKIVLAVHGYVCSSTV